MTASTGLAAIIILLLGIDWRYRRRSIRLSVILLTLVLLFFVQPSLYRAFRRAVLAPPAERVTSTQSRKLSEYESGVYTMKQAYTEEIQANAIKNRVGLAVLVWLAASPILVRGRRPATPAPGRDM